MSSKVQIPGSGEKITVENGKLVVPNNPIIPFIEGDGIGVDVTPPMKKVVDAAVAKASASPPTPRRPILPVSMARLAIDRTLSVPVICWVIPMA